MAKKSKKIEKETRRLIESISDLVKKKDNRYKFKGAKKKTIREVKRSCVHWIIRKGKEYPAVEERPDSPGFWTCKICGKRFPIAPLQVDSKRDIDEYRDACESFEAIVNQAFFYSVKMGGDASDTKVFLRLKELIPKFNKIVHNEMRQLNKRQEYEKNREVDADSQFGSYTSFSYKT